METKTIEHESTVGDLAVYNKNTPYDFGYFINKKYGLYNVSTNTLVLEYGDLTANASAQINNNNIRVPFALSKNIGNGLTPKPLKPVDSSIGIWSLNGIVNYQFS